MKTEIRTHQPGTAPLHFGPVIGTDADMQRLAKETGRAFIVQTHGNRRPDGGWDITIELTPEPRIEIHAVPPTTERIEG